MITKLSDHAFRTARLDVYRIDYVPGVDADPEKDVAGEPRACFVAIDRTSGNVGQAVTATIRLIDGFIEWLETSENCRRIGLATEILRGIERHLGQEVIVSGCTEAGEGLEIKWARRNMGLDNSILTSI